MSGGVVDSPRSLGSRSRDETTAEVLDKAACALANTSFSADSILAALNIAFASFLSSGLL